MSSIVTRPVCSGSSGIWILILIGLTTEQLAGAASLVERKQALIQAQKAAEKHDDSLAQAERRRRNRLRFREFRELDAELSELTLPLREKVIGDLEVVQQQMQANAVIQSREISFVLYPEQTLQQLFDKLDFT